MKINTVNVSSDDEYCNMHGISFDTFLSSLNYIKDCTDHKGETTVRFVGCYKDTLDIMVTCDVVDANEFTVTYPVKNGETIAVLTLLGEIFGFKIVDRKVVDTE